MLSVWGEEWGSESGLLLLAVVLAFQRVSGVLSGSEPKFNLDQGGGWQPPCGRRGKGGRFHKPTASWVSLVCHFLLSEGHSARSCH